MPDSNLTRCKQMSCMIFAYKESYFILKIRTQCYLKSIMIFAYKESDLILTLADIQSHWTIGDILSESILTNLTI